MYGYWNRKVVLTMRKDLASSARDEGGDDIFAHYSTIDMNGYKTLKAGQPVEFELQAGPKGSHATSIVPNSSQES